MASKRGSEAATAASGARTKDAPEADTVRFVKRAIMAGSRFRRYRDVLSVLLEDGKDYTIDEVETLMKNYMKGKVK